MFLGTFMGEEMIAGLRTTPLLRFIGWLVSPGFLPLPHKCIYAILYLSVVREHVLYWPKTINQNKNMAKQMRAKVYVSGIEKFSETQESIKFSAIGKSGSYPSDGSDEDNTFSKFSPMAHFNITIANPELIGHFKLGDKMYVDFTPIER